MKKVKQFLPHCCIIIILFLVGFVLNKLPRNGLIAGGDFYQIINPLKHYQEYFFTWSNQIGQGMFNTVFVAYPYYALLAVLDYIGFSSNIIGNFQVFFFFLGSFYSFYIFIHKVNDKINQVFKFFLSFIYAFNFFTYNFFIYPWGITHHVLIYIFIPILFGFFVKILITDKIDYKEVALYFIIFIISTISYNNIAFLIALLFLKGLFFVIFIIFKKNYNKKEYIKKTIIFTLISSLIFLYIFFPQSITMFNYLKNSNNVKTLGGNPIAFIELTSPLISNVLALDIFNFKTKFPVIINYFFLFFIIGVLSIKKMKNEKFPNITYIFVVITLILILLMVRIQYPFESINRFLYSQWFFSIFRSQDKLAFFYPFFLIASITGLLKIIKYNKITLMILLILGIFSSYKFFTGDIVKDLKSSGDKYVYYIEIPEEYIEIEKIINEGEGSIVSLPYSAETSLCWSNYPKWKMLGFDFLRLLYERNYISANCLDHNAYQDSLAFKEFNENKDSPEKMISILQAFGAEYIIYHKDILSQWQTDSLHIEGVLKNLKENEIIKNISENDYFVLYKLDQKFIEPIISDDQGLLIYKKISPIKYKISINLKDSTFLKFKQSYHSQWKLYLENVKLLKEEKCIVKEEFLEGQIKACLNENYKFWGIKENVIIERSKPYEENHIIADKFSNAWILDKNEIIQNYSEEYYLKNEDGTITIFLILYFEPQAYLYLGMIILGIIFISCTIYLSLKQANKYKKKKDLMS